MYEVMSISTRIKFDCNIEKTIEVILWFANNKPNITVLCLLKLLFFSDYKHLNKYGRPIIGDDYVAMQNGPVALTTYDILKGHECIITQIEGKIGFEKSGNYIIPKRQPNLNLLSKSDIECMKEVLHEYGNYSVGKLIDLTHEHKSWCNAWYNRESKAPLMDYADFFEAENEFYIEDLTENCMSLKM